MKYMYLILTLTCFIYSVDNNSTDINVTTEQNMTREEYIAREVIKDIVEQSSGDEKHKIELRKLLIEDFNKLDDRINIKE